VDSQENFKDDVTRGRRRFGRRVLRNSPLQSEALEPRLLLGSLVPTETGTMTGGLLPIETVDLLAAAETSGLSAGELALYEWQLAIEDARSQLSQMDVEALRIAQELAENRHADDAARESVFGQRGQHSGDGSTDTTHAGAEHAQAERSESWPSAEAEFAARAVELSTLYTTLATGLPAGDELASAGETAADELAADELADDEQSSDDDDDASADDRDTSTAPRADDVNAGRESVEATSDRDRAASSQWSGSAAPPASNFDLTFAAGQSPGSSMRQYSVGSFGSSGSSTSGSSSGTISDGSTNAAASASASDGTTSSTTSAGTGIGNVNVADAVFAQFAAEHVTAQQPVVIEYDFRSLNGFANEITSAERASAEVALQNWELVTEGRIQFEQSTQAPDSDVLIIYKGDLAAVGHQSSSGEVLGVGGTLVIDADAGVSRLQRVVAIDHAEQFDTQTGNGNPVGTYDFSTIVGHEVGHIIGIDDSSVPVPGDLMNPVYDQERGLESYAVAARINEIPALNGDVNAGSSAALQGLHTMITGYPQLTAAEVASTLDYATLVTPSRDAIIAIVDRGGNILGVRVEEDVIANFDSPANTTTGGNGNGVIDTPSELNTLIFAIDGAVAKARTAANFSNGDPSNGTLAPITSRTVRFISQTTITHREVDSNPNSLDPNVRGPGIVGPIGPGGHFPPEVAFTPPVDLFGIETTNRDSLLHPGPDDIKGTADDIVLQNRFNIDPAFVPAGAEIVAPESYGFASGLLPTAQSRGYATLPGGVPFFRDTNADGLGDTLIGGIGVFFPGDDGTALFEQDYQPGQSEEARTNAPKVIEAEFIALVAAGGSNGALKIDPRAKPGNHPIQDLDIPFGRLDLVGIQLQVFGPTAGVRGVQQLLDRGLSLGNTLAPGNLNGTNQIVNAGGDFTIDGIGVPQGWLVTPHDGGDYDMDGSPDITAADVQTIIDQAIIEAQEVRAAIRLPIGSRTRMVLAVTDTNGEVLGLFRMQDATVFSIEVAVSKARNTAYYADTEDINNNGVLDGGEDRNGNGQLDTLAPVDRIVDRNGNPLAPGIAMTNRTFRFVAEPRFPDGQDNEQAGSFSILNDIAAASGLAVTDERGLVEFDGPIPYTAFQSVYGYNSFNPSSNFRDPNAPANQSGVVFFPGSAPVYDKSGNLMGGFGVSGDGVDQDDVVTYRGAQGFVPPVDVVKADQVFVDGIRLPYQKFLRNPRG
jgi:uncharacterized protein GlcG (DUF336 family)